MKNRIILISLISLMLILAGCGSDSSNQQKDAIEAEGESSVVQEVTTEMIDTTTVENTTLPSTEETQPIEAKDFAEEATTEIGRDISQYIIEEIKKKNDKNAFDDASNQFVNIENIQVSIPAYFVSEDEENQYYYADEEKSCDFIMLLSNTDIWNIDFHNEQDVNSYTEGVLGAIDNGNILRQGLITVAGYDALEIQMTGSLDGINCYMDMVSFVANNALIQIGLVEDVYAEYNYQTDFEKVINSATVVDVAMESSTVSVESTTTTEITEETSTEEHIILLKNPDNIELTNTNDGVEITWNQVEGAVNYRVLKADKNGNWKELDTSKNNSYIDTSVTDGSSCKYTIQCVDESNVTEMSQYNTSGQSINYHATPSNIKVENTSKGVKISWDAVKNIKNYRVYSKGKDGKWKKIADVSDTKYTDTSVKNANNYTYSIKCLSKDKKRTISDIDPKGKSIRYISAISKDKYKVENGIKGVKITWNKKDGVTEYSIYRKQADKSYKKLGTVSSKKELKYIDQDAKNGKKYTYAIAASFTKDKKTYSSAYTEKTIYRLKRANIKKLKQEDSDSLKVSWYENDKCAGYQIRISSNKNMDGAETFDRSDSSDSSLIITDLSYNTYYVQVRCYKKVDGVKYTSVWTDKSKLKLKEPTTSTKAQTRQTSSGSGSGGGYYWTDSGRKYHSSSNCRYIRHSRNVHCGNVPSGYGPCSGCCR